MKNIYTLTDLTGQSNLEWNSVLKQNGLAGQFRLMVSAALRYLAKALTDYYGCLNISRWPWIKKFPVDISRSNIHKSPFLGILSLRRL